MSARLRVVAFGLRGLDDVEGGIETHARELYPRLAALGLDVTVLARTRYACSQGDPGLRVRPLWAPRGRGIEAFGHAALATAYCLATRPDVVHIHGIGPGLFSGVLRLAGLRVVVTHHGHDYDAAKWGRIARAALRWGERVAVREADSVIAVSRSIGDAVHSAYDVRPVVIGNGLPAWPAPPEAASPGTASLPPAEPYVLVVGRVTAHKRILDVVDAIGSSACADLRLVVCGDVATSDPYAAAVRDAARRDARVVLAGHVATDDLAGLYRRAACTVMPSSYEGLPLAVLEAIAAGCPVLVSDIPAHHELGLAPFQYFPVGDVAALAERLDAIVRLPREQATLVQSGCLTDARFDWDHIARATAAVLTDQVEEAGDDRTAAHAAG
jgi:glycosyltransferase involved in cell wall biosynthesis